MNKKILVTVSVMTSILSACSHDEHQNHHETLQFEVTNPFRKDSTLVKEYVSQIHAIQHIELRAMEKGYVQQTFVDEGQTVEQNQTMFKITPTLYQAELHKAQAQAKAAKIEYENTKALMEKNIVSPNELAIVKAEYETAVAEVELAQAHLDFTNIRAPFTGKLDRLEVRTGSLADEGELLTTLSDLSEMWVYFNVPESEYLDYMQNDTPIINTKVQLKLANDSIYPQQGIIDAVEADFDNHTGTIEMRASFPNSEELLRHGQTGNILIDVPYKNTLVIPQKATFQILDQTYVYVVDSENVVTPRHITIAAELPHVFIVEHGLDEKDTLLIEGLRRVHNGDHIDPIRISAQDALAALALEAE
ncbi:efflux RND transporter periplasmic adaptor subunit [Alteromonas sp. 5E99-2]|uniref:efflux RND transporter periplasmic adaptor subunit n=1 Tax=Alteromonas sp. 5E99-2 TaxID=2817683 RepID=UPI001A9936D6|nr:efflux RND transporter periplasmic adaptor subunit [Alteromonas sp. 5E99-2]MBO1256297.1 efflux RND transporter periplasmic adaptor subunit [Alteromonas sp. 5E99-2]